MSTMPLDQSAWHCASAWLLSPQSSVEDSTMPHSVYASSHFLCKLSASCNCQDSWDRLSVPLHRWGIGSVWGWNVRQSKPRRRLRPRPRRSRKSPRCLRPTTSHPRRPPRSATAASQPSTLLPPMVETTTDRPIHFQRNRRCRRRHPSRSVANDPARANPKKSDATRCDASDVRASVSNRRVAVDFGIANGPGTRPDSGQPSSLSVKILRNTHTTMQVPQKQLRDEDKCESSPSSKSASTE